MDVRCPKCGSELELDEVRIPAHGLSLECVDCRTLFRVAKPSSKLPPPVAPGTPHPKLLDETAPPKVSPILLDEVLLSRPPPGAAVLLEQVEPGTSFEPTAFRDFDGPTVQMPAAANLMPRKRDWPAVVIAVVVGALVLGGVTWWSFAAR